jgi:hypothetical protein
VTQAALGVVQRSAGLVVYCRPWGLVQVVVPSGLRRTFQPAVCLPMWWRSQGGCRLSGGGGPVGEGHDVVEVAGPGGAVAGGEGAGPVPVDHQLG